MTALKQEMIDYINDIPDDFLLAIKPLLIKLSQDIVTIERLNFNELSEEDQHSILLTEKEFENRETIRHEDIDWN